MVFRSLFVILIFVAAAAAGTPASAETARTTADLNMRSGPGVRYHRIAVIPAGSWVDVIYCLETRAWCKVSWRGLSGWVSSRYLVFVEGYPDYYPDDYYPDGLGLYFELYDRDWHDDHDRWHKKKPYPRRKSDQRRWHDDHDRWHKDRRYPRRSERRNDDDGRLSSKRHDQWHKSRPYPTTRSDRSRWNRDHDRIHRQTPQRLDRRIWPPRQGSRQ